MSEESLNDGVTNLLMVDFRHKLGQVGDPGTHGGNAFRLQFFRIGIEIIRQAIEIGIQQQRTVMKTTILSFAVG
ncbi:hypothetical protein D3C78_1838110 [compost metagenome]